MSPSHSSVSKGGRWGASRALTILFAAVPAIVLVTLLGWKMMPSSRPQPNGDPVAIAKFVNTHQFESLTENEKKAYMRTLRKKLAEVEAAMGRGAITRSEYAYAVEQAWMIRQLEHMEAYFRLTPGAEREKYLDQLVEKGSAATTNPAAAAPPTSSKNQALRDEIEKSWLNSWPEDRRKQWEEFRKVSHAKKQAATRSATGGAGGKAAG